MTGGWLQAFRTGFHPGLISETEILEISETVISEKTEISETEKWHLRPQIEATEFLTAGWNNPIAEARARGWHVEMRPAGLLIDTQGQPSDPALLDRLHVAMDQEEAWPAHLLADPGEVILRGELELIEQEVCP
ncbi:hypothetical protein [Geminicoccus flavidas]|uniref:hypothetical protein n=1 Tax=Geminicoccus flavidas TaxID=2506407 RepID=UPI00135A8291|nr:hypothetical protein [Geminicoccus flavidas]